MRSNVMPNSNASSLAEIVCDAVGVPKKDFYSRRKVFKGFAHATSFAFESLSDAKVCKN